MPIDLLVIPLEGCQIVLGVKWMKELGDVSFNFAKLQVKFHFQGHVYLAGIKDNDKMVNDKDITKERAQSQLSLLLYSKDLHAQEANISTTSANQRRL